MWACGFQSWPDPASALETTAQARDQFLSLRLLLQNVPMSLIKPPGPSSFTLNGPRCSLPPLTLLPPSTLLLHGALGG